MKTRLTEVQKKVLNYINSSGGQIVANLGCKTTKINMTVTGTTIPAAQMSWIVVRPLIRLGAIGCIDRPQGAYFLRITEAGIGILAQHSVVKNDLVHDIDISQ